MNLPFCVVLMVMLYVPISSNAFAIPPATPKQKLPVNNVMADFVAGPPLTEGEFNTLPRYIRDARERKTPSNKEDYLFRNDFLLEAEGRDAVVSWDRSLRWPNATIPYLISANYTDVQRQVIASAMNEYHKNTCIRFVPRTDETHYIVIQKTGGGCYTNGFRVEGPLTVSLDDDCVCTAEMNCTYLGVYVVQHELMHVAGFFHEQNRYDRDDYVIIYWDNIDPAGLGAYDKYAKEGELFMGTLYDYSSIMHYLTYDFAIDPTKPTMVAIDGSPLASDYLTETDILEINRMYCRAPGDCWDDDIRNGNCSERAAAGQCESDTLEMFHRCTLSCKFCDYPPIELQPDPNCADVAGNCTFLASKGDCQTNADYMSVNCRKACKLCTACEDLYSDCPLRASQGDCQKPETSLFMSSFCKRSCLVCTVI